jgi:membrane protease YdiL (CAAX protease family)
MLALAVPVAGHWLEGIWTWPEELYLFRPLYSVCVGAYSFMAVRGLEGIGYRLGLRKGDLIAGLANFAAFVALAIPLGLLLHFIHPHAGSISVERFASQSFGIYFTIAIPEELLFRGILQNFLVKSISPLYGIVLASLVFGASHLHHPPVPNWRYGILATLAGLFYGNAYRTRGRLSASALTHTLVDTLWHFWF